MAIKSYPTADLVSPKRPSFPEDKMRSRSLTEKVVCILFGFAVTFAVTANMAIAESHESCTESAYDVCFALYDSCELGPMRCGMSLTQCHKRVNTDCQGLIEEFPEALGDSDQVETSDALSD
jgi:hypothetical protein